MPGNWVKVAGLFDTCVDIEAIGLKCFQLMYPV